MSRHWNGYVNMVAIIADDEAVKPAGIDTIIHVGDDKLAIERKYDAQPILDQVQQIKIHTNGISKTGDLYHVARIPSIVIEKYCNEVGITFHDFLVDDTHVTRLLNDSTYKHLRIWEGRA